VVRAPQEMRRGLRTLACPTTEAGSSPALSWSSPEPWREVGEVSDGPVPPVSDLASRWGARAAEARGPSAWAEHAGRAQHSVVYPFPFCLKKCLEFEIM